MYIKHSPIVLTLTSLLTAAALAEEPTLMYVDDDGARNAEFHPGSIQNPFPSIRAAAALAAIVSDHVEIRVCSGAYPPEAVDVPSNTTIAGGYDRWQYSDTLYGLVESEHARPLLDGALEDSLPPDLYWTPFFRIVDVENVTISGLRMTNGRGGHLDGQAVTVNNSYNVTIENCRFFENNGSSHYAPLHLVDSVTTVSDCEFIDNVAEPLSGGAPGGAISILAPQVTTAVIQRCRFENNFATHGGAISAELRHPLNRFEITHCSFENNAAIHGGALRITGDSSGGLSKIPVVNCLFANNWAEDKGGAIFAWAHDIRLLNTTITNNDSPEGGAIFYAGNWSRVSLINTILWENGDPPSIAHMHELNHSTSNSLLQGAPAGPVSGWLFRDPPRFVNASAGNFRLQSDSPALDVGSPDDYFATWGSMIGDELSRDLDGAPRFIDSPYAPADGAMSIDLGCYERDEDSGYESLMCSPADIAPPLGVLDITDVLEFLTSYGSGCP